MSLENPQLLRSWKKEVYIKTNLSANTNCSSSPVLSLVSHFCIKSEIWCQKWDMNPHWWSVLARYRFGTSSISPVLLYRNVYLVTKLVLFSGNLTQGNSSEHYTSDTIVREIHYSQEKISIDSSSGCTRPYKEKQYHETKYQDIPERGIHIITEKRKV